jgi:hypothetical protein
MIKEQISISEEKNLTKKFAKSLFISKSKSNKKLLHLKERAENLEMNSEKTYCINKMRRISTRRVSLRG